VSVGVGDLEGQTQMRRSRAGEPISVDTLVIIPLEDMTVEKIESDRRLSVYASKSLLGVVIWSPHGLWGLDDQGRSVPVETYLDHVEGLRQVLDNL